MEIGKHATKAISLDNYGDLMTTADLSNFLGVSKQTIYKEIREGKFGNPIKFGREFRIPKLYIVQRYLSGYQE
ncbi:MAG: helix-turn-helix domain-containing protein [Clostridiales bacterium]|jgi:excisionase family DNA binding protein|nr:helix-turn-helix domain-containing protein [Clostridiales bacterium]